MLQRRTRDFDTVPFGNQLMEFGGDYLNRLIYHLTRPNPGGEWNFLREM